MRKANFTSFSSNSPGKARAVFKLYLGVKSKLKKKRTICIWLLLQNSSSRSGSVYIYMAAQFCDTSLISGEYRPREPLHSLHKFAEPHQVICLSIPCDTVTIPFATMQHQRGAAPLRAVWSRTDQRSHGPVMRNESGPSASRPPEVADRGARERRAASVTGAGYVVTCESGMDGAMQWRQLQGSRG